MEIKIKYHDLGVVSVDEDFDFSTMSLVDVVKKYIPETISILLDQLHPILMIPISGNPKHFQQIKFRELYMKDIMDLVLKQAGITDVLIDINTKIGNTLIYTLGEYAVDILVRIITLYGDVTDDSNFMIFKNDKSVSEIRNEFNAVDKTISQLDEIVDEIYDQYKAIIYVTFRNRLAMDHNINPVLDKETFKFLISYTQINLADTSRCKFIFKTHAAKREFVTGLLSRVYIKPEGKSFIETMLEDNKGIIITEEDAIELYYKKDYDGSSGLITNPFHMFMHEHGLFGRYINKYGAFLFNKNVLYNEYSEFQFDNVIDTDLESIMVKLVPKDSSAVIKYTLIKDPFNKPKGNVRGTSEYIISEDVVVIKDKNDLDKYRPFDGSLVRIIE